ncbi:MAG: hypothetical protein G01um101448_463 [Parcubacteria group bacterium Gr01-1014_48]|nr:MAG: hypothetical protein Greene041614_285 [Parcubacteria group bacterium Greene0416_14]TSC73915.1 MAG: hypothetical protein G01um101448_463 [Parcubacteria group bacterium Gr01-1014_48]TSD00316.1 MAG: hypothetical protein Greene101415_907 [Parcubacteria group bacterium Greene1014_15]TSD07915.1 MAG: hypothetical protein Greene07144_590 [Parcubacteria group bacterium Greene0714_4]
MKKIKSEVWFIHWYKYCQAYLSLAHIGLLELKNETYRKKFDEFEQSNIYTDKILLVPTIWCLKHAIELLFKALIACITKEFSATHENPELHEEIKRALASLKIKDNQLLRDLIFLSDKYYKLNFWNSFSISNSSISDDLNDVFRYPESKVNFNLGIEKFHEVKEENHEELENDIKILHKLLLKLSSKIGEKKSKAS